MTTLGKVSRTSYHIGRAASWANALASGHPKRIARKVRNHYLWKWLIAPLWRQLR